MAEPTWEKPEKDLPDYIADNWGTCSLGEACKCVVPGQRWLGRLCDRWIPVKARDWEELKKEALGC